MRGGACADAAATRGAMVIEKRSWFSLDHVVADTVVVLTVGAFAREDELDVIRPRRCTTTAGFAGFTQPMPCSDTDDEATNDTLEFGAVRLKKCQP